LTHEDLVQAGFDMKAIDEKIQVNPMAHQTDCTSTCWSSS
jgi:hypothetical protein